MPKKSQVESVISDLVRAGELKLAKEVSAAFVVKKASSDLANSDVIDSRDVNERIEELEGNEEGLASDEQEELAALKALAEEGSQYSSDWPHGETLIKREYFTEYTKELIHDAYEWPPKGMDTNQWPYKHMTLDYEAAASDLLHDYTEIDFAGHTWYIRNS